MCAPPLRRDAHGGLDPMAELAVTDELAALGLAGAFVAAELADNRAVGVEVHALADERRAVARAARVAARGEGVDASAQQAQAEVGEMAAHAPIFALVAANSFRRNFVYTRPAGVFKPGSSGY